MSRPLVVAKIGGSLLDWPDLPRRLTAWIEAFDAEKDLVLVPGGGPFADVVRRLDAVHHLGDQAAHVLAIRAMDLAAHALAALATRLRVVRFDEVNDALDFVPIVTLAEWLEGGEGADALPASWDVTSDSIAASVARCLHADELILFKSVDLKPLTTVEEAARLGIVDPAFPSNARPIPRICWVNLRSGQAGEARREPRPPGVGAAGLDAER